MAPAEAEADRAEDPAAAAVVEAKAVVGEAAGAAVTKVEALARGRRARGNRRRASRGWHRGSRR